MRLQPPPNDARNRTRSRFPFILRPVVHLSAALVQLAEVGVAFRRVICVFIQTRLEAAS